MKKITLIFLFFSRLRVSFFSHGGPVISVIISGGAGSCLWPLSRDLHPKPFRALPCRQRLLEEAYSQAVGLPQTREILPVTNPILYFQALDANKSAPSHPDHTEVRA